MTRSRLGILGVAALLATSMLATASFAQSQASQSSARSNIYTGGPQGAYHSLFCPPLPGALSKAYFTGYQCTTSGGTTDNISKVLTNPVQIGFVQLDVFAREVANKPELGQKLQVIRELGPCEALIMVTRNPAIKQFGDVLGFARRIPFVVAGGGSKATFEYLQSLDANGLGRAGNVRYVDNATSVIAQVGGGTQGEVGFFVQFADPSNANIKAIKEKGLTALPVVSHQVVGAKVGNQNVYQVQSFSLTEGGLFTSGNTITTACTPVAIITGSPASLTNANDKDDQSELIKKIADMSPATFLPQESSLSKLISGAKRLTASAVEELAAAADKAKEATVGK